MRKQNKKVIFWVDYLGWSSFWKIVSLLRGFNNFTLYHYRKASPFLKHLLRFISSNSTIEPLSYSLGNMKTKEGLCLRYQVESNTIEFIDNMVSKIIRGNNLFNKLNRFPKDKLLLYLKQKWGPQITEAMSLFNIIDYYYRNDSNVASVQNIMVSKSGDILNFCLFKKDLPLTIVDYWNLDRFSFQRFDARVILGFLGQVINLFVIFPKPKQKDSLPKIGMASTQSVDINKRSVLFWLPHSSIERKRFVLYFEDTNRPLSKEQSKLLDEYGINWLVLRKGASLLGKKNLWQMPRLNVSLVYKYIRDFFTITKGLFSRGGYFKLLQWHSLVELLVQVYYYEVFFRDTNIRILWNMEDTGHCQGVRAIALELAKGISVSTHCSNYPKRALGIARPYDVFFVWNRMHTELFRECKSCFNHVVQCGFIYDCYFDKAKEKAEPLRKELHSRGVSFIVGFMDNIYSNDYAYSKEALLGIYQALLNLTISDDRIGLILKPKRLKDSIGKINELDSLVKTATETGRCLILDKINLDCFSVEAGLACDFAIGLGISSTTVENGLAGVKVADYDTTGNYKHVV
ncbi:hypothetical protein HQ584_04310 [Patescibacteria group bacterium]|nr:hypothetical protein [Patescibacteria group bacterium]